MRTRIAGLVVLALLTVACHDGSSKARSTTTASAPSTTTSTSTTTAPTTSTTTTTTTSSPTTTGPCAALRGALTNFTFAPSDSVLLTAVTLKATAPCTDAVTFTFRSSTPRPPGVQVKPVRPPFVQAGSGAPITVAGDTFYAVRFEPAGTYDFETGQPSYAGPQRIAGSGSQVRELVMTEAFEGVVTWIVGVRAGDRFTPAFGTSPPSLVLTFGT